MNLAADSGSELHWFAVQAKPCRERFAASHLGLLGVEVFFPELKHHQDGGEGAHRNIKPLFPGYLFARFRPLISLDAVRYAPGVLRVIGGSHCPTPVAEEILVSIQALIEPDGYARLAVPTLHPGDRVTVSRGPLEGTSARFEQELDDGRRVAILLETIQRARVILDRRWIETAAL